MNQTFHSSAVIDSRLRERYGAACSQACRGRLAESRESLEELSLEANVASGRALILNDLAVLMSAAEQFTEASLGFNEALELDATCWPAQQNASLIQAIRNDRTKCNVSSKDNVKTRTGSRSSRRIAILSLLFNWPSTGGGTIHTYEAATFLQEAGFQVQHIFAEHATWGLGQVKQPLPYPSLVLQFDDSGWRPEIIRQRFRDALGTFAPDAVIVTDSWNTKPLLCEAASEYPYFVRIAALESICPLNNVRMLLDEGHRVVQCSANQLASPQTCVRCVSCNRHLTGDLHRAERALAGFDALDYAERLRKAFAHAEGVLVVNPAIAALVEPFATKVHIVPSGFDPARFPRDFSPPRREAGAPTQIIFAGLVHEYMKGFHVLQEAATQLWSTRQDFEIVVTADPVGRRNEFTRFIGWQSQDALPKAITDADILAFPTVAQEALGRSAVEAMGCGRPVIASRLGGLPYVVYDNKTGLLFEPGNAADLADKLSRLLDSPALRVQFGQAGREKFFTTYPWDVVISAHYEHLLRSKTFSV